MVISLELRDVSYSYGSGHKALKGIDMTVKAGTCTAVVGPNGAGKTTLLRIMAGLIKPTSGKVIIQGKGRIGMLFQDPDDQIIMPTVREDVAFGPYNMGVRGEELDRRVERAMKLVGIEDLAERMPHHLSFGEKKKVSIAGVLAMKPDVILLDEPTANLDPYSREEIMRLVLGLPAAKVIATHDLESIVSADSVIVLDRKILASGPPGSVLTNGKLLRRARLKPIPLAKLFIRMSEEGMYDGEIPLDIDSALEALKKHGKGDQM